MSRVAQGSGGAEESCHYCITIEPCCLQPSCLLAGKLAAMDRVRRSKKSEARQAAAAGGWDRLGVEVKGEEAVDVETVDGREEERGRGEVEVWNVVEGLWGRYPP